MEMNKKQRRFDTSVYGESVLYGQGESLGWVKELQRMALENRPLYLGRLENDSWQEDDFLFLAMEEGFVEILPEQGFVITEKGRKIIQEYGLDVIGAF